MPILNLTLSTAPDAARSAAIAATLTGLTARLLRKNPALTAIAISHAGAGQWFVGGQALATDKTSFFLDIRVTDGSNTREEKTAYIGAVFAAMAEALGELHDTSYVHVHEARAEAWGYGGRTQQARALQA